MWKFVSITSGILFVMGVGVVLMLVWLADNWDSVKQVHFIYLFIYLFIYQLSFFLSFFLSFSIGAVAITSGFTNGEASQPIYNNNYGCRGSERRLIDCPKSGGVGCDHTRDAGVSCQGGKCVSLTL